MGIAFDADGNMSTDKTGQQCVDNAISNRFEADSAIRDTHDVDLIAPERLLTPFLGSSHRNGS